MGRETNLVRPIQYGSVKPYSADGRFGEQDSGTSGSALPLYTLTGAGRLTARLSSSGRHPWVVCATL